MNSVNSYLRRLILLPLLGLVAFAVQLTLWAIDRRAPFELTSTEPAIGRGGEVVDLRAYVQRDLSRECHATYTRFLYDGAGFRHDLGGPNYINAAGVADLERRTPGELRIAVRLPTGLAPGRAALVTTLDYSCNPLHRIWPVHVVMEIPFEVTQ